MRKNFLQNLISKFSPDVFKPIPEGELYLLLQSISRELSGECSWDEGTKCQKGYDQYWYFKCRAMSCPGYRHPLGLIAYTSESDPESSVDNRFNYSSIRYMTRQNVFTVGAVGGFGAGYYGSFYYGGGSQAETIIEVSGDYVPIGTLGALAKFNPVSSDTPAPIGDKWYISCYAQNQLVGPAVSDTSNRGSYNVSTFGTYTGKHDTVYTVEIIDFLGYMQNFENALFQMCLATCEGEWVDFWGEYFGISRLLLVGGFETDDSYKARIIKEITMAKGTKSALLEAAKAFFKSEDVSIVEYCQVNDWDDLNTGKNPTGGVDLDRLGLMPYQFYIYPPAQSTPSALFAVDGTRLDSSSVPGYGASATLSGRYIGTQFLVLSTTHQPLAGGYVGVYDPGSRDANNCYIYRQSSWEKPVWETGFQEIIDRLKTAGTCAIVNPHL